MKRGFYVGRFQPYHNGHQAVLTELARTCDEIIIGVGSAQLSHTTENPYTAGERVLMITRALTGLGCPYYVIPIEDVQRNALWAAHVMSMTPPFDTCYSSNPLVVRLFCEAGWMCSPRRCTNVIATAAPRSGAGCLVAKSGIPRAPGGCDRDPRNRRRGTAAPDRT